MKKNQILRIALPTPLPRLFDYLCPQDIGEERLISGVRVVVPFQSRKLIGILINTDNTSAVPVHKLKAALEILDDQSIFTLDIYRLCLWASDYYHYPLGEVLIGAIPALLRKGKDIPTDIQLKNENTNLVAAHELNAEQKTAINDICAASNTFKIFLLDGVTGSGKTEVYLQVITQILAADKQVLVLVPEISLTPQTIARFQARFLKKILALHSSLTDKQRLISWQAARMGKVQIVIGTRSAIFTPFSNLGLIVVDEEHDTSFKQQDRFRYHARDLAIVRARELNIPIVLGSATPSLETLFNARRNRYSHLFLRKRAGVASLPSYQLVDIRNVQMQQGLSPVLIETMRRHLANNNQVMLFLNRRGFAPVLYCNTCHWICECKRCDARMVYHRNPPRLHCHHCDSRMMIPSQCPECKNSQIEPIGLGTQRLEEVLAQQFPDVPIIRIDRDSTKRKGAMKDLLAQIHEEKPSILLGTQMLAKGHHFPQVTLVGIVDADSGLFSADFRAAEQMGQLLLQVSGRAGRAEKPGTVLIQTRNPEHPLFKTLIEEGYAAFAENLLNERQHATLPPYSYFAIFKAESYDEANANNFLNNLKNISTNYSIDLLGPVPALISKKKGLHCKHLIVKANKRIELQNFLKKILNMIEQIPNHQSVKWVLDVDPVEV